MTKKLFFFTVFSIFTTAYSLENNSAKPTKAEINKIEINQIIDTWVWEKTIGGEKNPYVSTPKTIGFKKKIIFTPNGKIITYKDDIEIRNSSYEITKGTGVLDQLEHDLITFEGKTYIVESIDNQSLILVSNDLEGARTTYKK